MKSSYSCLRLVRIELLNCKLMECHPINTFFWNVIDQVSDLGNALPSFKLR